MFKRTLFCSMLQAEAINEPDTAEARALISITGPVRAEYVHHDWAREARLKPSWGDVLRLKFHDIDPKKISRKKLDIHQYFLFNEAHAIEILKFLRKNEDLRSDVIVHCEAGVSRSAGVAKFIAEIYQLQFPETYSLYNRHVFSTLLTVYGRCAFEEGVIVPNDLPAWRLNSFKFQGVNHGSS